MTARRLLKALPVAAVVLIVLFLGCSGFGFLLEIPFWLLVGWAFFVRDNLYSMEVELGALLELAVTLGLLMGGGQLFLAWLARARQRPPWRWTQTGALLLGFVLMFCVSIASAGVIHQASWLAAGPVLESSWDSSRFKAKDICYDGLAWMTAEELGEALLDKPRRYGALELSVVQVQPFGGELLIFPHDGGEEAWRCTGAELTSITRTELDLALAELAAP